MSKKEDLRTVKTKRLIRQTFLDLMKEKGYQHISVTDIANRALINRKTFYFYYESVEALYLELADELIWLVDFSDLLNEKQIQPGNSQFQIMGTSILEKVREEKEIFLIMMNDSSNTIFNEKLKAFFFRSSDGILNLSINAAKKGLPPELIQNVYSSIFLELVRWWLTQDDIQASQALSIMVSIFSDKLLNMMGLQLIS